MPNRLLRHEMSKSSSLEVLATQTVIFRMRRFIHTYWLLWRNVVSVGRKEHELETQHDGGTTWRLTVRQTVPCYSTGMCHCHCRHSNCRIYSLLFFAFPRNSAKFNSKWQCWSTRKNNKSNNMNMKWGGKGTIKPQFSDGDSDDEHLWPNNNCCITTASEC